jgi:hypothetical protein
MTEQLRPARTFVPPSNPAVHADTRRRVLAQEQEPLPTPATPRFCVTACSTGPITSDVESNPWRPRWSIDLDRMFCEVIGAPDTWVATLLRDEDPVLELGGTGDGTAQVGSLLSWAPNQQFKVAFTGEAAIVTVSVWFHGYGGAGLNFATPSGGGG